MCWQPLLSNLIHTIFFISTKWFKTGEGGAGELFSGKFVLTTEVPSEHNKFHRTCFKHGDVKAFGKIKQVHALSSVSCGELKVRYLFWMKIDYTVATYAWVFLIVIGISNHIFVIANSQHTLKTYYCRGNRAANVLRVLFYIEKWKIATPLLLVDWAGSYETSRRNAHWSICHGSAGRRSKSTIGKSKHIIKAVILTEPLF